MTKKLPFGHKSGFSTKVTEGRKEGSTDGTPYCFLGVGLTSKFYSDLVVRNGMCTSNCSWRKDHPDYVSDSSNITKKTVKNVTSLNRIACPECGKLLKHRASLKKHIGRVHNDALLD